MRAWHLDRTTPSGQLELSRAAGLVAALGARDTDAFAAEVLRLLNPAAAVAQCTVFAYEAAHNRARPLSVAGRRGPPYLREIADLYARRFAALDDNRRIFMTEAAAARGRASPLTLHQQDSGDIEHEAYRRACYQEPGVCERIALLMPQDDDLWLSVSLFRDRRYGKFQADEIGHIEALAPLLAQATRQHYALCGQRETSIPELMLARVRRHCPALSKRELDVLRGVLEGCTAHEIAERIGVKASSVTTYQKRAFHRLGISGQRQLFALCLTPA